MPSTIEFNGKKYNALTGNILSEESKEQIIKPTSPNTIDGVIKSLHSAQTKHRPPVQKTRQAHTHVRAHSPEKPKTLMRQAVTKPKHAHPKKHTPKEKVRLYQELTRERAIRARSAPKSKLVSKFHKGPLPRKNLLKNASLEVTAQPSKAHGRVERPAHQAPNLTEKFEQAIESAQSHLETYADKKLRRKKTRRLAYALASFSSVFLIGFGIYQAMPFIKVKLASEKAGFSANLPAYSPSGYGLDGNLQAKSGEVALIYNSKTSAQNYRIVQSPSEWNSQSLLNNFLLSANKNYQRLEENGQTIFLYDSGYSATWLNNGIWYRLEGNTALPDDQLVRIANSL